MEDGGVSLDYLLPIYPRRVRCTQAPPCGHCYYCAEHDKAERAVTAARVAFIWRQTWAAAQLQGRRW